jgi:small-conductance mechanosensitive channel
MFLDIAVAAIGIGVVVMVGYLVVYNVKNALPVTNDTATTQGIENAQTTVYAGFALVAVGIIVLAAFGLISVFK